ncbi:MAG: hypothetical protein RBR85_00850 [Bacilli bacterium]|jgi:hypothetical protein|nr:hypothetical protein [Bacilli bacterium]
MDEVELKIEIDSFYHKIRKTEIWVISVFEILFLFSIGAAIYFFIQDFKYAPLFLVSMLLNFFAFPYFTKRLINALMLLVHYGFIYHAKKKFLVYEITILIALEGLFWLLSAVFVPTLAIVYYLALPSLCAIIIAIILERYVMKELLLQIKKSRRAVIYDESI